MVRSGRSRMDLLIAAVGLLVAVYAILPRERRLDLGLRFGTLDIVVCVAAGAVVGYLDLYSFFKAHGLVPKLPTWSVGLNPTEVIHVVLAVLLLTLAFRARFARLSTRKIHKFQELAEELLWSQSYLDLLVLFQPHLRQFLRIYHGDFWTGSLRERWLPNFSLESFVLAVERGAKPTADPTLVGRIVRPLVSRLPKYGVQRSIAANTARNVLLSRGFVSVLARSRPYLGLEIVQNLMVPGDKFFREEFVELYIDALLSHKTGIFYSELANTCNRTGLYRYEIPSESRLLHFLFAYARTAYKLQVWRPVGEFMLRELDQLARAPETDPYNRAYTEEEAFQRESSLFAGVQFFEIMVSEALFQGIEWHMWLYYATYIVRKIVRNYQPADDPLIAPNVTYPIWYSHLLYVIFRALRDWVLAVREVPPDQSNVRLESTRADHENGNIPKSSILALGDCLRSVLTSDRLEEKLRNSLADLVLRIYFELRGTPLGDRYAESLLEAIRRGGFAMRNVWTGVYRDSVRASVQRQDRLEYGRYISDLEAALR